jgi:hypothetical protein
LIRDWMSQEALGSAVRYLEMPVEAGEELRDWLASACEIFDGPVQPDQSPGEAIAANMAADPVAIGGVVEERVGMENSLAVPQPARRTMAEHRIDG